MPIDLSNLTPEERRMFLDFLRRVDTQLEDIGDTYSRFSQEAKDHLSSVKESYKVQSEMKDGLKGLFNGLKKISNLQKQITALEKEAARVEGEKKDILDEEIKQLKILQSLFAKNFQTVSKSKIALKEMGKVVGAMPKTIVAGFNKIKSSGIFEMDKSIKKSALNMGLLGNRSKEFRSNIRSAQDAAIELGVTIQELAEMQAGYSDELGRSVLLGKQGLEAITDIAKGTGLGVEAATKMTGEFDAQGLSAKKTAQFMEQTMNDASSMGLNASTVIKNIQNNIKLLNKYNFKGGVKGLAKMAETVTKLGMDMNTIAPMADKLFNIEGAVEMSAQLQVLGGKWSQLADPFKLMYQARNDMDGLVKSIGEAAAQSASLDEDGNIKLASVEMARLRQVAETTGVSYEELAEAAKRAGKATKIKEQISFLGLDSKEQEFLTNIAEFENGRATIEVNGKPQFLDQLGSSAKTLIQSKMQEQKTLKERAKMAMSFDEQVNSIITQLKQYFLPLAESLADPDSGLAKSLTDFRGWLTKENIGAKIESFAKTIGSFASSIGSFLLKTFEIFGPAGTLVAWGALKAATWIANGVALAKGFNAVAKVSGGGGGGGGGALGRAFGKMGKFGGGALGGGIVGGLNSISSFSEGNIGEGIGNIAGGAILGTLGSAFGPIGTMIGAQLGSMAGGWLGGLFDSKNSTTTSKINDGVVFNPNDKFMKVNDGTMIAGTNENGNKSLAKALMTTMTPVAQTSSIPGTIKLSDLNVSGIIELKMNGNSSSELGKELLNDPIFIRNISRAINMATSSAFSGTQPQKPLR